MLSVLSSASEIEEATKIANVSVSCHFKRHIGEPWRCKTATRQEWLPSLHEYIAVCVTSPSLAGQMHSKICGSGCRPRHSNPWLPISECWPCSSMLFVLPLRRARATANGNPISRHSSLKLLHCSWTWTVAWALWNTVAASSMSSTLRTAKNKVRLVRELWRSQEKERRDGPVAAQGDAALGVLVVHPLGCAFRTAVCL